MGPAPKFKIGTGLCLAFRLFSSAVARYPLLARLGWFLSVSLRTFVTQDCCGPCLFCRGGILAAISWSEFLDLQPVCLTSGSRWLIQGQWKLSCYLFPTWNQSGEGRSEVSLSVLIRGWPKISGMRGTPAATRVQGRLLFIHPGGRAGEQSGSSAPILFLFAWNWRGRAQLLSSRSMHGQWCFFFSFLVKKKSYQYSIMLYTYYYYMSKYRFNFQNQNRSKDNLKKKK